jgi:hypothetical protein
MRANTPVRPDQSHLNDSPSQINASCCPLDMNNVLAKIDQLGALLVTIDECANKSDMGRILTLAQIGVDIAENLSDEVAEDLFRKIDIAAGLAS